MVYVLRPNRTALWLPDHLAATIHANEGDTLTEKQFNYAPLQDLLKRRREANEAKHPAPIE